MNKGFFSDYASPQPHQKHSSRRALMREFLSQDDCDSFSIQEYKSFIFIFISSSSDEDNVCNSYIIKIIE